MPLIEHIAMLLRRLWLLALCILSLSAFGRADTPLVLDAPGLKISAGAVDPATFHVTAWRAGNAPPSSPFVVETAALPDAVRSDGAGGIRLGTKSGTLGIMPGGHFRLQDGAGRDLLPVGTVAEGNDKIILTLTHDPHDLFYGAGNESRNHAGDLWHPAGDQIVNNGTTRVPFLWSSGGWSVFVANDQTGISWHDDHGTLTVTITGPFADFYLGVGANGYALLDAYSRLTGRAPIPPRWTFGFMMSRWGYAGAADVRDKWRQFRDRKIPVDAFIYDYDWFRNDWEFNLDNVSPGSLDTMRSLGLKFVGIRKPRVTGANLEYGRKQGWILNDAHGTDLRFDLPVARYWWWSHHVPLVRAGVAGWWNDEAEQTADEFFQMTRTEWEGWRAMTDQRAWEINRAFAPGIQRFGAATWTGDIDSTWEALGNQPGTLLNWSLAGMPYSAQDIGGFQGTPEPELYVRWIEEGVFVPVMRAHGTLNSPRWPWAFGDQAQAAATKAIELRYRLIPYLYTLAAQTTANGVSLMRPLVLEFPADEKTFNLEDEWLVGDRLLAAPVLTKGGARTVYLPAGVWYDFNSNARIAGGQTLSVDASLDVIPAYVRAGTILPLGPVLPSTSLGEEDSLEVRVYPGADADFTLYEDDGDTYAYEQGASARIPLHWDDARRTLTVGSRSGSFPQMLGTRHLSVVLPDGTRKASVYSGNPLEVVF